MLNATIIIRRLEKKLGFKFMDFEISHEEIIENLKDETLKVFSKYFPYQETCIIDPKDKVEPYNNRFYLKVQNECIGVNRLVGGSLLGANYVTGLLHPIAADMLLGDPISRQLNIDLMSFTSNPITFKYIEPGMIEITPTYNNVRSYIVVVNTVHPDHFGTIPISLEDEFMKYALADTQSALLSMRTRFANMNTPYGNIELYLDQFQGAEDKKEQIEEKWRQNSGKNGNRKKIFIA
jgi:hypothetical protein